MKAILALIIALGLVLALPLRADPVQGVWVEPLGRTKTVCVALTVTASSAYEVGDSVGGLVTFPYMFRDATNSGQLVSVRVTDKAATASDYDFIPISSALSGGSTSNGATPTILDADLSKILPMAQLTTNKSFADNGYSQWSGIIPLVSSDTSLRALVTVQDTPTYASASDLTVCATVWQD